MQELEETVLARELLGSLLSLAKELPREQELSIWATAAGYNTSELSELLSVKPEEARRIRGNAIAGLTKKARKTHPDEFAVRNHHARCMSALDAVFGDGWSARQAEERWRAERIRWESEQARWTDAWKRSGGDWRV